MHTTRFVFWHFFLSFLHTWPLTLLARHTHCLSSIKCVAVAQFFGSGSLMNVQRNETLHLRKIDELHSWAQTTMASKAKIKYKHALRHTRRKARMYTTLPLTFSILSRSTFLYCISFIMCCLFRWACYQKHIKHLASFLTYRNQHEETTTKKNPY